MQTVTSLLLFVIALESATSFSWSQPPLVPELAKNQSSSSPQPSLSSTSPGPSPQKREPWDFIRFVKQSSKFVSLPKPPTKPSTIKPGDTLFSPLTSSFSWGPLDDVVMGGVSSSTFNNKSGQWNGYVTDKNSGGFIGIRTTPFNKALDMSLCKGVEFTLKNVGDKKLKAVVRDSTDFNGICWTDIIGSNGNALSGILKKSKDNEVKLRVPFEGLVPTIFARTVPDQELKKDNIVAFQLVYSKFFYDGDLNPDFTVGAFSLDLVEVKAY